MFKDSPRVYGVVTRTLHWLIAVLLLIQLIGMFSTTLLGQGNAIYSLLAPWHKTLGVTLLLLIVVRVLWALTQIRRRPNHEGAQGRLAVAGHVAMYVLLVLMPLSGVLMSWGGGYGVKAFGAMLLPQGADVAWASAFHAWHGPIAWGLSALIVGHVAMALHHHFGRRDGTLRRMVGREDPR